MKDTERWLRVKTAPGHFVEEAENGHEATIVFDIRAPLEAPDVVAAPDADDWITARAAELDGYWLVTSDRQLRERAGARAERVLGGGSFANELRPRG